MTGSSSLTDVVGGRLVCFRCPVGGGGVGGRERVVVGEGSAGGLGWSTPFLFRPCLGGGSTQVNVWALRMRVRPPGADAGPATYWRGNLGHVA